MKIGILTSGGDCPGLNAVIRGVVLKGTTIYDQEFVGFRDGWRGVVDADFIPLKRHDIQGIRSRAARSSARAAPTPSKVRAAAPTTSEDMDGLGVDALIAIGGEGTLAAANRLTDAGINIVGVPKTIDNDLSATDYSFGFDTAVNIATDAMDRLRTTGDSHRRCMVAEVMGRHVGWIALHAGMAAGAHAICIPEVPLSIEEITALVSRAHDRGRAPLIVVSEGFTLTGMDEAYSDKGIDAFNRPRLGGISEVLAPEIERRPASRPVRRCSATSSAAARPRRSTVCSPPASASTSPTPSSTERGVRWSRCAAPTSCACPSPTRSASSTPCPAIATTRPRRSSAEAPRVHRRDAAFGETANRPGDGPAVPTQSSARPTTSRSHASSNARSFQAL